MYIVVQLLVRRRINCVKSIEQSKRVVLATNSVAGITKLKLRIFFNRPNLYCMILMKVLILCFV